MPLRLLCGRSNRGLARDVASRLGLSCDEVKTDSFADGELSVELPQSVRGEHVFVIQPTSPPVNDHLMELLLIISACRRASAKSVTAVLPYYGYARQDRISAEQRTTISAADVATMMVGMGVSRVVTVELHAAQIQGFFPGYVPVDDLSSISTFVRYLPRLFARDGVPEGAPLCIVSPDAGGVSRAKRFRDKTRQLLGQEDVGLAIMIKHRARANVVEKMDLVGDVEGAHCVLVDDITDTCGTLLEAARQLHARGAASVYACIAHGVLSDPACERLEKDTALERLCILDTIAASQECAALIESGKIEVVSSAPMIAEAISAISNDRSLSTAMEVFGARQDDQAKTSAAGGGGGGGGGGGAAASSPAARL